MFYQAIVFISGLFNKTITLPPRLCYIPPLYDGRDSSTFFDIDPLQSICRVI